MLQRVLTKKIFDPFNWPVFTLFKGFERVTTCLSLASCILLILKWVKLRNAVSYHVNTQQIPKYKWREESECQCLKDILSLNTVKYRWCKLKTCFGWCQQKGQYFFWWICTIENHGELAIRCSYLYSTNYFRNLMTEQDINFYVESFFFKPDF